MVKVEPQSGSQVEEFGEEEEQPVPQLQLQVYDVGWKPEVQPRPQRLEEMQVQPVQSPQAQLPVQVRFWHVPHPSVVVAPIVHTGVPCSSHPSERSPLQSL